MNNILVRKLTYLLIAASISLSGCLVTPIGNYHAPESVGRGEVRPGAAISVAPEIDKDLDVIVVLSEADLWLDLGVTEGLDLRTRAFLVKAFPAEYNADFWVPGISLESKLSNSSGTAAFIAGASAQFFVDVRHEEVHFLFAPWLGGVFGIGRPGKVRLLLSPRIAAGLSSIGLPQGAAAALSVGLDLPITEGFSIRPEASLNCSLIIREGLDCNMWEVCWPDDDALGACWLGLGTAVMF